MIVFAVTPLYPPRSRVGSWLATHELLAGLAHRGHEVQVMPWMQRKEPPYDHEGVRIVPRSREIVQHVERADIVVSHLGDNGLAHRLATTRSIPSIRLVHSPVTEAPRRLRGAALVVANSRATADAIDWPGELLICPPITWPERHETKPGAAVTLVNLSREKGAELFWELAEAMPDVDFLGVRGGYGLQIVRDLPNVTVLPTQADMREVWRRTRILLMPSAHEAWGMTGIEAMCSGIPVIAHPTPGLTEALGKAGFFCDRKDPAGWQRTIRTLLRPSAWTVASRQARARVAQLDPARTLADFIVAVEKILEAKAA